MQTPLLVNPYNFMDYSLLQINSFLDKKEKVIEMINEQGDIERPVALGMALMKEVPEFRKIALKAGFAMMFG